MLSIHLMKYSIIPLFLMLRDTHMHLFISTEQMDTFVWTTLIYFNDFLDHERAVTDENISVHG